MPIRPPTPQTHTAATTSSSSSSSFFSSSCRFPPCFARGSVGFDDSSTKCWRSRLCTPVQQGKVVLVVVVRVWGTGGSSGTRSGSCHMNPFAQFLIASMCGARFLPCRRLQHLLLTIFFVESWSLCSFFERSCWLRSLGEVSNIYSYISAFLDIPVEALPTQRQPPKGHHQKT